MKKIKIFILNKEKFKHLFFNLISSIKSFKKIKKSKKVKKTLKIKS